MIDRFIIITTQPPFAILLCLIYSCLDIVGPYDVVLCCYQVGFWRLKISLFSHVQVFSCEIALVCHLKCSYRCYSSCFCFLISSVQLMLVLSIVSRRCNKSSSAFFLCSRIDSSTLSWMLASPLPLYFLDIYSLSTSSLGCKALCIVLNFLIV